MTWYSRCIEDAGVRYRNPHVTRHTFATRWLRRWLAAALRAVREGEEDKT